MELNTIISPLLNVFLCGYYPDRSFLSSGVIVGIITSIVASVIILFITEVVSPYFKYSKISGVYIIYWIKDWANGGDEIDFDKPMGEAKIIYQGKSKLEIIYKQTMHDNYTESIDHKWKGTLIMETPQYGNVAFYFITLFGEHLRMTKHRMGYKRVTFIIRENHKIVYLTGEKGYGKEVLIEKY